MNIFIIPKGLSQGVINAQMVEMVKSLNTIHNNSSVLACHVEDAGKIDESNVETYKSLDSYLTKKKNIKNLYIRSLFDFIKAFIIKHLFKKTYHIIYDFRGIVSEETFLRNRSVFRRFVLQQLEKFIYRKADSIHTVSNKFENYLIDNYGSREITVVPCCIKNNYLKSFEQKTTVKFVYVGGMAAWQKFDVILDVYKTMSNEMTNTSLTVITLDQEEANRILKSKNLTDVEVKSMSQEEVTKDLRNYDFGFLLRDDVLLNNVASPIKFVEYISQGVIPIVSKGIGDYADLVEKEDIGLLINIDDGSIDIKKIKSKIDDREIHKKLYEISNHFLWEKQIDDNFFSIKR